MPRPYDHFRRDAADFIRQNRTDWTTSQAQNTISTIWAAVTAVRTHYAGSEDQNQSPDLPAPHHIPLRPCTKREADRTRKTGQLPPRLQGARLIGQSQDGQPQGPQPPGGQQQLPQGPPFQQVPAQQPPIVQPPVDPQPAQPARGQLVANIHPDRVPYSHWPQLPWTTVEHDLRVPQSSTVHPEPQEQEAWLGGRPYGPGEQDNGMWQGIKHLGGGSYGIVGLWVRTDPANNIEQRMVIKDTVPTVTNWRDPHNWRDRIPKEIRIHQLVEERRREDLEMCRHVIRYLGFRLHMAQRRYRLYLEFCSHGILSDAIWKHSKYWIDKESALKDPNKEAISPTRPAPEKLDPEVIPEAFIWSVIKALASACLLLQTGTNTDLPGVDGLKPITHLDIQNPNIFLQLCVDEQNTDLSDSDQGETELNSPKRKRNESVSLKGKEPATSAGRVKRLSKASITTALIPILGDFGLSALSLDATDKGCPINDNPDNYVWSGYHPRYAPEHQFQFEPKPLGQKIDVWGIGNIAWQLVTNRISAFGPAREDQMKEALPNVKYHGYIPIASWYDQAINLEHNASETLLLGRYFPASARYGEELKQLVRHCLDWETEDRPDLKAVHDQAKRALEHDPEAGAILSDIKGLGLYVLNEDEFRIGQPAPERYIEQ